MEKKLKPMEDETINKMSEMMDAAEGMPAVVITIDEDGNVNSLSNVNTVRYLYIIEKFASALRSQYNETGGMSLN